MRKRVNTKQYYFKCSTRESPYSMVGRRNTSIKEKTIDSGDILSKSEETRNKLEQLFN